MVFSVVLAAVYVYLFPSLLAVILRHPDPYGVVFVNLAMAWSIIGWFLVLIWALDVKWK
jgi:hypothetical protein